MRELPREAPPRFEVRVLPDAREAARAAAREVAAAAADAVGNRGIFRIALSGGSTPRELFRILARRPIREEIDWSRTRFFFVDERCVPPRHPRSNYRLARERLIDPLGIPSRFVFRMRGEDEPRRAARAYEELLTREFGSAGRTPRFDFVLLGLGADGHTASLFPGTRALDAKTKPVAANYVPGLREWRLTLTFPVLNAARRIVVLVGGEEKRRAASTILGKKRGWRDLPASHVKPKRGSLIWVLDAGAAADL